MRIDDESPQGTYLSIRTTNQLLANSIFSIEQIEKMTIDELRNLRGVGKSTVKEIRYFLSELGKSLRDDLLVTDQAQRDFILSIPEEISKISVEVLMLRKKLDRLLFDLDHIKVSLQRPLKREEKEDLPAVENDSD